jgi:hypothetical protein
LSRFEWTQSHDDGTFEFAAVEQGDWRLSAEAGVADDKPLGGVAAALVSESDVEDVRIRLSPSFPVESTWENGQRSTPLGLTSLEGQPRATVDDPAKNVGKVNHVFPGRYRVLAGTAQTGSYVTAVMWGGHDVNGQVVDLAPGAGPFQVILSSAFREGSRDGGEGRRRARVPDFPRLR